MKIGFYLDFSHLTNFSHDDFNKGLLGISGTDSSFIRVVNSLTLRQLDVTLFASGTITSNTLKIKKVVSLSEATQMAIADKFTHLIFVYKEGIDLQNAIHLANNSSLKMSVWAQNPAGKFYLDFFAKANSLKNIIYVEQHDANQVRHHIAFNKAIVIPNGIEKEIYANKVIQISKENKVCFLGSLTYSKGFHLLAKAWPEVRKVVPDAKLIILGSGKLYDNKAILGPLGLGESEYEREYIMPYLGNNKQTLIENGVDVKGLINRNQLLQILPECKVVCINPNIYGSLESCSVSSLESQMLGIPVVAGNAGGNLCTILDRKTGFLTVPEKLQLYIIKLLADKELAEEFGTQARKHALGKYELQQVIDIWESFLVRNDTSKSKVRINGFWKDPKIVAKEIVRLLTFKKFLKRH